MFTPSKNLAKVALVGFALGPLLQRPARAYYGAAGILILTGATTSGAATTAGIVVLILKAADVVAAKEPAPGSVARTLIDTALITSRGDLALQLELLSESPSAFARASDELAERKGPAVDALVQATGLPVETLASHWYAATRAHGPVTDEAGAQKVVAGFLARMAPELAVERGQAAELAWKLERERTAVGFPAEARTHLWLAEWMGVPVDAVAKAGEAAAAGLGAEGDARARIYAEPERYLDALAVALEATHKAELDQRTASLVEQGQLALPPEVSGGLVAAQTR